MTIKNIFKIDFLTYIFIFICLFSGLFKNIIIFMSLIIFHELGHFLSAFLFNWKIDKIYIYPLGGVTVFNDSINKPFIEEFVVTIMGPLFQIITAIFLSRFDDIAITYNNYLLLFNLLPIVPLDGSRLLGIILSIKIPYKKQLNTVVFISYLLYFLLIIISLLKIKSIFIIIVISLLIIKIREEHKKNKHYFNKFILERYLYDFKFKNNIIITNINNMYKYKNNYLKKNNRLLNEKEFCYKMKKL